MRIAAAKQDSVLRADLRTAQAGKKLLFLRQLLYRGLCFDNYAPITQVEHPSVSDSQTTTLRVQIHNSIAVEVASEGQRLRNQAIIHCPSNLKFS